MKGKEIQEQEKSNVKNKKKQKLKEKGITLIALVVTIIILLILAGVTLNMAMNGDGLFSKARNVADKYKKAQEDEQDLISEIGKEMNAEYVGVRVIWNDFEKKNDENAYKVESDKSGAENEQTFKTEDLAWRIWDYDGKTIRIISDKPTTKALTLKGVAGYNNGVYLINEICRQCYGQYEDDGKTKKTGISVSNLRRSDIQKVSTYYYNEYTHDNTKNEEKEIITFGENKIYNENNKYPAMWECYDRKWKYDSKSSNEDAECLIWEIEGNSEERLGDVIQGNNNTIFKQSYYSYNYKNGKDKLKDRKYYDMLFTKGNDECFNEIYWLAGRTVDLLMDYCYFEIQVCNSSEVSCGVGADSLYMSDDKPSKKSYALRPLISVDLEESGYFLEKVLENNAISYKISKKIS